MKINLLFAQAKKFMNDNNLEKFIFFRFVKISYIVLISLFLIWMIKMTFIMLENKEVDYLESKVECYNGKQIELCCDPFLHVKLSDYKLDEKSDFLVCVFRSEMITDSGHT